MLKSLYIENYALIEQATVEFGNGLNVLTGETGSGKSIIIGAIGLIVGEKAGTDQIMYTKDRAIVEAIFSLNSPAKNYLLSLDFDTPDNEVVITRELSVKGKNVIKINHRPVTQAVLKELTKLLIDIHGQHEHQSLFDESKQIDLLDDFIDFDKQKVIAPYQQYRLIIKQIEQKKQFFEQQQEDYYQHLYNELEAARIQPNEYTTLKNLKNEMSSFNDQSEKITTALNLLEKGLEQICLANATLSKIKNSEKLKNLLEASESSVDGLNALQDELHRYCDQLSYSPQKLDEVINRLDLLNSLKIKHLKNTLPDQDIATVLLAKQAEIATILQSINHAQDDLAQLQKQAEDSYQQYLQACSELSKQRKSKALEISAKIEQSLKDLNMQKTQFQIEVSSSEDSSNGQDRVRFLISPNPGQPLRPLAKIGSGGELSRVMLAIKAVLLKKEHIPTMIFDEIDTGIGGVTAVAIADKMKQISLEHQILVVTHLPQIAKSADNHLVVSKQIDGNQTGITVKKLTAEQKVSELTRMLGGESAGSLAHAKEMLQKI